MIVDVAEIRTAHNDRLRFDPDALASLARAYQSNPAAIPRPVVRPHPDGTGYELVAGERRIRAQRDLLGRKTVDVDVVELDDAAARAVMLGENENRVALDAFEQAAAYKLRIDADGMSIAELAASIGRGENFVRRRLFLLGCCAEVVDGVRAHALPIGAAERIGAAGLDPDHQRAALRAWIRTPNMTLEALSTFIADLVADQDQGQMFELTAVVWDAKAIKATRRPDPAVVLGTHEVADLLEVGVKTVQKWRERGQFAEPDLVVNRLPAWRLETVVAWTAEWSTRPGSRRIRR